MMAASLFDHACGGFELSGHRQEGGKAGYSANTPERQGHQLLKKTSVSDAIKEAPIGARFAPSIRENSPGVIRVSRKLPPLYRP